MPLFMSLVEFAEAFPSESEFVERKSSFNRTAVQEAAVALSNTDGVVRAERLVAGTTCEVTPGDRAERFHGDRSQPAAGRA